MCCLCALVVLVRALVTILRTAVLCYGFLLLLVRDVDIVLFIRGFFMRVLFCCFSCFLIWRVDSVRVYVNFCL